MLVQLMSKMIGSVQNGQLLRALRNRTVRTTLRPRIRCNCVQKHRSGEKHRKRDALPNASQSEPNHQQPAFDPKITSSNLAHIDLDQKLWRWRN